MNQNYELTKKLTKQYRAEPFELNEEIMKLR